MRGRGGRSTFAVRFSDRRSISRQIEFFQRSKNAAHKPARDGGKYPSFRLIERTILFYARLGGRMRRRKDASVASFGKPSFNVDVHGLIRGWRPRDYRGFVGEMRARATYLTFLIKIADEGVLSARESGEAGEGEGACYENRETIDTPIAANSRRSC